MSGARKYVVVQQATASNERLTVMLFETALRHMRVAMDHLQKKQRSAAMPPLAKASAIVTHLHATLKQDAAPRLVAELMELYTFTAARLSRAMATGNPADVREAERAFAPIADGFAQAVAIEAKKTAAAATAAAPRP